MKNWWEKPQRHDIIGIDFDDTLFLDSWPSNYRQPQIKIIEWAKKRKAEGSYLILVTCREGKSAEEAVAACAEYGLYFDAVNENHPDNIKKYGDCRKIYCDVYLDDKNISLRQAAYGLI